MVVVIHDDCCLFSFVRQWRKNSRARNANNRCSTRGTRANFLSRTRKNLMEKTKWMDVRHLKIPSPVNRPPDQPSNNCYFDGIVLLGAITVFTCAGSITANLTTIFLRWFSMRNKVVLYRNPFSRVSSARYTSKKDLIREIASCAGL